MLSFQIVNEGKAVQICCDHDGMSILLEKLAQLIRDPDHVHLRSPASGGKDLSETTPFGEPALGNVIIDYSPDYTGGKSN